MTAKRVEASGNRLAFELGRWSEAYMAQRASEITNFHCIRCKKDFHGISMYEHWSTCAPDFFRGLSKHKKRRVGYAKQGGFSAFDPDGISPELQQDVVLSKPGEDQGSLFEDSRSKYVKQEPEPVSKIIGRLKNDSKDTKAF